MSKYIFLIVIFLLSSGCSLKDGPRIAGMINKTLTFRTYEFYSVSDLSYWTFDIDKNKRINNPHDAFAQIDDKNRYILFAFDAYDHYERTPKFTLDNLHKDLKSLFIFVNWASKGLDERNEQKENINKEYKSMGLKYVVVNEANTNEPLLIFRTGGIFIPEFAAYPKKSIAVMILTAIMWKNEVGSAGK